MFDIGSGEIIGLAILGMILVGPERLPKAAADAARFIKRLREVTSGAGDEFEEESRSWIRNVGYPGFEPKELDTKACS